MVRSVLLVLLLAGTATAQELRPPAERLRVVTKDSPPFAFQDSQGHWRGITIELAEEVARRLGVVLEIDAVDTVEALLTAVEEGRADAAAAAITVTRDREHRVDFSHPYHVTGLGVAVRGHDEGLLATLLRNVTSTAFLQLLGVVVVALIATGLLFYVLERRKHPQFNERRSQGIGTGIWWSTVILFGHKGIYPKTFLGCVMAATGMLVSILILSVLTGAIASILTVSRLEASIRGIDDLRPLRTAAVEDTSGARFLARREVSTRAVPDPRTGLDAVAADRLDALVHDRPILQHLVRRHHADTLQVLHRTFEEQDYALAFALGSPWRKPVNQALLGLRAGEEWDGIVFRYLGR